MYKTWVVHGARNGISLSLSLSVSVRKLHKKKRERERETDRQTKEQRKKRSSETIYRSPMRKDRQNYQEVSLSGLSDGEFLIFVGRIQMAVAAEEDARFTSRQREKHLGSCFLGQIVVYPGVTNYFDAFEEIRRDARASSFTHVFLFFFFSPGEVVSLRSAYRDRYLTFNPL